jgi:hypothetical protein
VSVYLLVCLFIVKHVKHFNSLPNNHKNAMMTSNKGLGSSTRSIDVGLVEILDSSQLDTYI